MGIEGRKIKGEEKQMGGTGAGRQVKDEGWKAEGSRDTRHEENVTRHNKHTIKKIRQSTKRQHLETEAAEDREILSEKNRRGDEEEGCRGRERKGLYQ